MHPGRSFLASCVAVASLTAVAVLVVTQDTGSPPGPSAAGTSAPPPAGCVPESRLDHGDLRTGTAAWVLPVPGLRALAWDEHRVPQRTYAVRVADGTGAWGALTVTGRDGTVTLYRADGTSARFGHASPVLLRALGLDAR